MTQRSTIALPAAHLARTSEMCRNGRRLAALLLLALPAAGCANVDRTVATFAVPADYHQRHPVALANARQSLDVFLVRSGGRLDYRQKHDIEAFSADYIAHGEGRVQVLVPRGSVSAADADATLAVVQNGLAASGIKGEIEVGFYRVADAHLASVLRLSYVKLQAVAASHCGDWPQDLNSGSSLDGWENRTYYNLGCASQQTLAAQMDDPRDLVRPRADDPSDVQMRTRGIQDLRGTPGAPVGQDPSTTWGFHFTSLGTQVSN